MDERVPGLVALAAAVLTMVLTIRALFLPLALVATLTVATVVYAAVEWAGGQRRA